MKQVHENLTMLGNWLIVSPSQGQTGWDTTIQPIHVNYICLTANYIKGNTSVGFQLDWLILDTAVIYLLCVWF